MSENQGFRVFFEPQIPLHDPALYSFERTATGVDAADAATQGALDDYFNDGFLMVRGLLSGAEVIAARTELERMAQADPPGCQAIWYEGKLREHLALDASRDREISARVDGVAGFAPGQEGHSLPPLEPAVRARFVRKFMGFVERQPALTALARHPALLSLASRIIEGRPELFQDMALVKPAQGREKPWHQDHAYFNVALDTPIVGVWIPMGDVGPENGCMHMLAGGHRQGPRIHFKRRDWQICDDDVSTADRVAVPMRAGDVLFFDGKIPHGTPINRTDDYRWAVQFHYRPAAAVLTDDAVRLEAFGSEGKDVTC